ncbi:helix-turn-helix transcriptional regulator [Kibdelosporangium persicum]|uniref:Transcriptional regulator n=1 Tax=Kibdelosporangium persicum TaxID=2698649 RepID=A0ABX2F2D5_9PSEU|nr:helix-turn-helix transcriptional regulator [Kibdelosporangium persicum]NRN65494.1 Transcriptional regulator [Kibdelosporangium persicum]
MEDTEDLSPGSLVRRWRLGKRLRMMRVEAGRTMDEAAAYIGVKRPTISRIETGRQAILARNVKFLCQLYDVGAPEVDMLMRQADESNERGWWASYSDTMPDWFETYVGFEADAKEIWLYCSELVPGILQTAGYQRALKQARRGSVDEEGVAFRLERQRRLADRQPRLRIVLNEAVLRRKGCDMDKQISHLTAVSKRTNVSLQVLTFDSGPHAAMRGPFNMLTLPEEPAPNLVYLEHNDGAVYLERPIDLAKYSAAFESLTKQALSAEDTRDFLATLA